MGTTGAEVEKINLLVVFFQSKNLCWGLRFFGDIFRSVIASDILKICA
jgi:hypothetical protein